MLSYSELKPKTFIVFNGEPYEVLSSHIFSKQQRKPVNQTKIKNLINGKVVAQTFYQRDSIEEADIAQRELVYIYTNKGEVWFHENDNPKARFSVSEDILGDDKKFLKEATAVVGMFFNEELISVRVPIKITLKVTDTPPNIKGNTAQGGSKPATLETGAVVTVPLFIEIGDMIEVNTEKAEYVQRITE